MRFAMRSFLVVSLALSFLCAGVVALGAPTKGPVLPKATAPGGRPLTEAEIEAATTPPSGEEMVALIRASAKLSAAVRTAATKHGVDATKLLAPKTAAAARTTRPPLPRYELAPCDWEAGIWLTLKQTLAAPSWPSSEWAALVPQGLMLDRAALCYAPTQEELARRLPWTGLATMMGMARQSKVDVEFRPPGGGLFTVVLSLATAPASASDFVMTASGSLLGSEVKGRRLVVVLWIWNLDTGTSGPGQFRVTFASTRDQAWQFGGASIQRASF